MLLALRSALRSALRHALCHALRRHYAPVRNRRYLNAICHASHRMTKVEIIEAAELEEVAAAAPVAEVLPVAAPVEIPRKHTKNRIILNLYKNINYFFSIQTNKSNEI